MPTTPVGGSVAILKFGTTTVPAKDWNLSLDPKLVSAANFADGRLNVPTLLDADFSCDIFWNSTSMPHDPAGLNLVPGTAVTAKCYVSTTAFYSAPIMVSTVDIKSEIEGILMYNVKGKLNGVLVTPVIS